MQPGFCSAKTLSEKMHMQVVKAFKARTFEDVKTKLFTYMQI